MKTLKWYFGIGAVYSLMKFVAASIKKREELQSCYEAIAIHYGDPFLHKHLLNAAAMVFVAFTWPIWLVTVDIVDTCELICERRSKSL